MTIQRSCAEEHRERVLLYGFLRRENKAFDRNIFHLNSSSAFLEEYCREGKSILLASGKHFLLNLQSTVQESTHPMGLCFENELVKINDMRSHST